MGWVNYDPVFSLAGYILAITILVAIWKLLGYIATDTSPLNSEKELSVKPSSSVIVQFFRFILHFLYPSLIVLTLSTDYPLFKEKDLYLEGYLFNMSPILILQAISVCSACLLWIYSQQKMISKPIYWGLFLLSVGAIVKTISQHSIAHWIQLVELLLSGGVLLIIPLLGFVVIKNIPKLALKAK
jgi:hypothetical protein